MNSWIVSFLPKVLSTNLQGPTLYPGNNALKKKMLSMWMQVASDRLQLVQVVCTPATNLSFLSLIIHRLTTEEYSKGRAGLAPLGFPPSQLLCIMSETKLLEKTPENLRL